MNSDLIIKKSISLYVHIPFCEKKCNYCAFVSHVGAEEEKTQYVKDLIAEIKMRAKEYSQYFSVKSIFIGGGTPSCLNNYAIRDILSCIYKSFSVQNSAEITIEVNPNTVNRTKIREYILAGVNRISMGLQSSSNKVLKSMGRLHTQEDFTNAVNIMREQGLSNINADIIIGYPGQTQKDVQTTVDYLINMEIPHISCYMLQVEDHTPLKKMIDTKILESISEEKVLNMYNAVLNTLKSSGYHRYEVSNFAKLGFDSKHNKSYWDRSDYLGFGVAAHSYVSGVRFSNTTSIIKYHKMVAEENKPPVETAKELTKQEKKEEFIMLSLRTSKGLSTKEYEKEFGENFVASKKAKLASLIKGGFLTLSPDGIIRATDKGYMVLNKIILELTT